MSVTIANIITNINTYIGDSSNDRITEAERLQAITEAISWLQEETGNDHMNQSNVINYFDTVKRYKLTTSAPDMLDPCQLRRSLNREYLAIPRKSPRELYEEIGSNFSEDSFALERVDNNWYLLANLTPRFTASKLSSCESLTVDGGTWSADTVNSDAINLRLDTEEYTEGTSSFAFDIDVSQSVNNKATIYNDNLIARDYASLEDISSFIIDAYLPDITDITSFTIYWGSSSSNYWSVTSTTDIDSSAFVDGWNTIKFDWSNATKTGTPDASNITFFKIDINYDNTQIDDTHFRIDNIRLVRPEKLAFVYTSWRVGTNNSGTDIYAFGATTDIPYFSGQYDQYKFPVAHKAASICYRTMRLSDKAQEEDIEAQKALLRIQKIIPSSRLPELKSFKVKGIRFGGRFRR